MVLENVSTMTGEDPVKFLETILMQSTGVEVSVTGYIYKNGALWVRLGLTSLAEGFLVYRDDGDGVLDSIVVFTSHYLHALQLSRIGSEESRKTLRVNNEYVIIYLKPTYNLLKNILCFEKIFLYN